MCSNTVHFVVCPECSDKVPLPAYVLDEHRSDPFDVAHCPSCSTGFDYDSREVRSVTLEQWHTMTTSEERN